MKEMKKGYGRRLDDTHIQQNADHEIGIAVQNRSQTTSLILPRIMASFSTPPNFPSEWTRAFLLFFTD